MTYEVRQTTYPGVLVPLFICDLAVTYGIHISLSRWLSNTATVTVLPSANYSKLHRIEALTKDQMHSNLREPLPDRFHSRTFVAVIVQTRKVSSRNLLV